MGHRNEVLLEMHELLADFGAMVHLGYQAFDPSVRGDALALSAGIKELRQKLGDALEYFRVDHPSYSGMKGVPDEVRIDNTKFASFLERRGPELFGGILLATDEMEKLAGAERPLGAEHLMGLVYLARQLSPMAVRVWA